MITLQELREHWKPNFLKVNTTAREFFSLCEHAQAASASSPSYTGGGAAAAATAAAPAGTNPADGDLDWSHVYYSALLTAWTNSSVFRDVPDMTPVYGPYLKRRHEAARRRAQRVADQAGDAAAPATTEYVTPDGLTESDIPSGHVWLGAAGVASAAHYDAIHNLYIQLHGFKRFVLLPPAAHRVLYTFPR